MCLRQFENVYTP